VLGAHNPRNYTNALAGVLKEAWRESRQSPQALQHIKFKSDGTTLANNLLLFSEHLHGLSASPQKKFTQLAAAYNSFVELCTLIPEQKSD